MKKFLKGVTIATALTFTISPIFSGSVNAFSLEELQNSIPVSNTLKATFNVSEPIPQETVGLSWFINEETSYTQTFDAVNGKPYEFTVNITPGTNIQDGIIDSQNIALLLKVPDEDVNAIEGVYPYGEFYFEEPPSIPVLDDPSTGFSYYVLAENMLVNRDTDHNITSFIEFNTSETYEDFEVIAVQDPADLFTVLPGGPDYATFTLDTQGDTGEDLEYPNYIYFDATGGVKSHGDFDFEVLGLDPIVGTEDYPTLESLYIYKTGNSYRIDPIDTTPYVQRPTVTLKISGRVGTPVEGLSHTIKIQDIGDFRNVIAIDDEPVFDFPRLD